MTFWSANVCCALHWRWPASEQWVKARERGGRASTPGLRVTPDENRSAEVVPIRTATNTALAPVHLPISRASYIAVSPDSSTVYVIGELLSNYTKYAVFPIRTGAKNAGQPVPVPENPVALVFAP